MKRDPHAELVRQHEEARSLYRRGLIVLAMLPVALTICGAIALLVPGGAMVAVTVALLFCVGGMPAGLAMYESGRDTYRRTTRQLGGEPSQKQLPPARVLRHH